MKKSFKKAAALFLTLALLVFTLSGLTAGAEEPAVPEKSDEPQGGLMFSLMKEAAARDEAAPPEEAAADPLPAEPATPNVTNVKAKQISDTQFTLEMDSDAAGTKTFLFSMVSMDETDEFDMPLTDYREIPVELSAGANTFTYDFIIDGMMIYSVGYETADETAPYVELMIEYLEQTEGDFTFVSFLGESYILQYSGPGGNMAIPEALGGKPVTYIDAVIFTDYFDEDGVMVPRGDIVSVSIPSSVDEINPWTFGECLSLESISVAQDNPEFSSADGVLFNKDKTELLAYPPAKAGDYIVPDGVTSIEWLGFWNCEYLTNITIPASVAEIESLTFTESYALETITLLGNTIFEGENDIFPEGSAVVIRGLSGSPAQAYAAKWGFTFEAIDTPQDPSSAPVSAPSQASSGLAGKSTGKTNNPKTADMSSAVVWFVAMILAAGVIFALSVTARKKKVAGR
ncbi:MAG TPA: hypothetical protein DEQ02_08600 [Ruminococcaceae bacterium]|nr:hypothetical protein [Oscillospiraceae bacterium]